MDGVLWRGHQPIGDLPAIFDRIQQIGWHVALATNNATLSVDQYVRKLNDFGVRLDGSRVITSGVATAHYLANRFPEGGPVYILGEEGLSIALSQKGFYFKEYGVIAVIVGMDRELTFDKLKLATMEVRKGALFIGTNPDRTFPTPEGLIPGAGSILAAIEAATGQTPVIIGKPQPEMYGVALENLGTSPEDTLVVGDRLETDIIGGQALGCKTALVLSGVTDESLAQTWSPPPDLIVEDLNSLLDLI